VDSTVQISGRTANNFRSPLQYTVSAEDGSINLYTITVSNALVANAGSPQNVATNSLVMLDGSASVDPNGTTLTFSWQFTSKPVGSGAVLSNSTSIKPTFTADVEGSYSISLVITDGKTNSSTSSVVVVATPTVFTSNASFYSTSSSTGTWSALSRKISVLKTGAPWDVELFYNNVNFEAGKTYRISFICSNMSSSTYMIRINSKD